MNRDEAREKLIDLVYGELTAAERQAVMEQVAASAELAQELARLQTGHKAMASLLAGAGASANAAALPAEERLTGDRVAALPGRRQSRPRVLRWLAPLAAAAAAVIAAALLWQHGPGLPQASAQTGPIEIQRTEISLTILSTPERAYGFSGLALVRDQRLVRHLPQGESNVAFTDVPTAILPDSVRLRSLDNPRAMTILEQNYQYDLASTGAILQKYVDKPIKVTFKDGSVVEGDLLSFDSPLMPAEYLAAQAPLPYNKIIRSNPGVPGTLVIRPKGEGPRNISRADVQDIAFPALPHGLLTRPTLLWKLSNTIAQAKQSFEVAYMTRGIDWRADYVLKLRPGPADGKQTDTADLVGYATVTNNAGVTFANAQLKLLAGDVNLVPEMNTKLRFAAAQEKLDRKSNQDKGGFEEKSFFEYHLYTLGRPTTIQSAETKQIEMLSATGVKMKRLYFYDRNQNATAARVVSELKNDQASGLGQPLPKGLVRLFAPGAEGQDEYASQQNIDHTAKDDTIRLPWGYAFDIACSSQQTENKISGDEGYAKWRYELSNQKAYDVTVIVVVHVPAAAYKADCDRPWHVKQVGLVEIPVRIERGARVAVDFGYAYNNRSGGGLKSPHVEEGATRPAK